MKAQDLVRLICQNSEIRQLTLSCEAFDTVYVEMCNLRLRPQNDVVSRQSPSSEGLILYCLGVPIRRELPYDAFDSYPTLAE